MTKLSSYQTASLMLCFTAARLIAYRPEGDSLVIAAVSEIIGCAAMFLVSIPLLKMPPAGGLLGKVFSAAAAGYCIFALTFLFADFTDTMQYGFPNFYSSGALIAALAAAAAYCSSMGLSGCARAACAAIVLAVLTFALMTVGAADGIDTERLDIAVTDRGGVLIRELGRAAARSAEYPLLIMLMRRRTSRPVKAAGIYLAGRAALWCAALGLCACVLGEFGTFGEPFWSLAAYSKTSVIERFDALVMLFWTLCTLISAAALLICLKERVGELSPKLVRWSDAAVIVPAVIAFVLTCGGFARPDALLPAAAAGTGAALAAFCKRGQAG